MHQRDGALVAHDRRGDEGGGAGKEAERARVAEGVLDQHGPLPAQHLRLVEAGSERRRVGGERRELVELLGFRSARERSRA